MISVTAAATFFFLVFAVYLHKCSESDGVGESHRQWLRQQPGLSSEVVETFPTLMYAEVMGLKMGNGALECAICLAKFEDEDELRLLAHCSHVFHPDCVGTWLASNETCLVCHANLCENVEPPSDASAAAPQLKTAGPPPPGHVSIVMDPAMMVDAAAAAVTEEARSPTSGCRDCSR